MNRIISLSFIIILFASNIYAQSSDVNTRTANEERVAREQKAANDSYRSVSKHKKRRRKNLEDIYGSVGLGYTACLGGTEALYKNGFGLNITDGFPIIKEHAVLELQINSDILFSPNTNWFANAYQIPAAEIGKPGAGFYEDITFGFYPVILNTKNITLTVGPFGGGNFFLLPSTTDNYGNYYSPSDVFSFCYGAKTNLYIGEYFLCFAQFTVTAANSVAVTMPGSFLSDNNVPANFNALKIGACFKFDAWGWW